MSWSTLPPEVRRLAERVCTVRELEALKLWDGGAGYGRIALMLGVSKATVRDRVKRGLQKIAEQADRDGMPL